MQKEYDVIEVGGGHAGCEAAVEKERNLHLRQTLIDQLIVAYKIV